MMDRLRAGGLRAGVLLRTIRVRLTLWYVGLMALILLGFSVFLYLSLSRSLHAEVDRSLEAAAQQAVATLDVQNGYPLLAAAPEALPAGMVAALYDRTGTQMLAIDPRQPLPVLSAALAEAAQGHDAFNTVRLASGEDWRVLTTPVLDNGQPIALLQVGRSEVDAELALGQLVLLTALAVPATLVLAVAGGLFLAGRALGPIARVTRTAGQIGGEDLSRRLNFNGVDDEVGRLAATFDQMLERLEVAFRRQRQFTADASHELRTPLAMFRSQIDVTLGRRRSLAAYEGVLASLREDTDRMSQLVSALLMLARADDGQDVLVREQVDLHDLAEQVAAAMGPMAAQRGLDLRLTDGTPVPVLADQTRLMQLAVNLVDNALKYTPSGGIVTISAGPEGDWGALRVIDTGIGIAAEHLPHLFERFYRVDKARARSEGGAGLGLAICWWIAEAHGGTIAVDSQPGVGTTVTLRLPLATRSRSPSTPAAPQAPTPSGRELATRWPGRRSRKEVRFAG